MNRLTRFRRSRHFTATVVLSIIGVVIFVVKVWTPWEASRHPYCESLDRQIDYWSAMSIPSTQSGYTARIERGEALIEQYERYGCG